MTIEEKGLIVIESSLGPIALGADQVSTELLVSSDLYMSNSLADGGRSTADQFNRLVTAAFLADLFDMDRTWFLSRARENRIPHVRLGKYVRFDPVEVRAFFDKNADRHANS